MLFAVGLQADRPLCSFLGSKRLPSMSLGLTIIRPVFALSTVATISWKPLRFIATRTYLFFSMNIIFSRVFIPAILSSQSSSHTNTLEMIKFTIKILVILIWGLLVMSCPMIFVL